MSNDKKITVRQVRSAIGNKPKNQIGRAHV